MSDEDQDLKNKISLFYDLLKQHPDDPRYTYDFISFLRSFLKVQSKSTLPTIEIMTLIQHYKPIIFYEMKKLSKHNVMLDVLTKLTTDVNMAEERLKKIIEKI